MTGTTFSPTDLSDAQQLLQELAREVQAEEGTLSGGQKLGIGGEALQSLLQTRIAFGNPTDNLIRLTPKLFQDAGLEPTETQKRQMRDGLNFYYLTLNLSLQPKRGAQFSQIECSLDFGPKGQREPIIQDIFPKAEWRDVLSFGGGLKLALNSSLAFETKLGVGQPSSDLPAAVAASLSNQDKLASFVVVPDFSFNLGRAEITATGVGNSESFWRIEHPDLQEWQTVQFSVVFKIPQEITAIELTGLAVAQPKMSWLTANLRHVLADLNETLQRIFRQPERGAQRLPIGDHETWRINLPT